MKFSRFLLTLAFSLVFAAPGWAERKEIHSMSEVLPLLERGTVVIFDLDNTTLRPTQTLGSDQFFRYLLAKNKNRGLREQQALELTLAQVTPVQPRSAVAPVEAMTPGLIRDLQSAGYTVFALTARPELWSEATIAQLATIGVSFLNTAPVDPSIHGGIHFQKPGAQKGPDLVELLARLQLQPEKIVFIDDREANVESVEAALDATPIPHWSLRYGALDEWVASFDPEVADLEWRTFQASGRFMSDEEARVLIGLGH